MLGHDAVAQALVGVEDHKFVAMSFQPPQRSNVVIRVILDLLGMLVVMRNVVLQQPAVAFQCRSTGKRLPCTKAIAFMRLVRLVVFVANGCDLDRSLELRNTC